MRFRELCWSELTLAVVAVWFSATTAQAQPEPDYRVRATAELGTLAVLAHHVQFGKEGTYFDYVSRGGQNNLFFAMRFSIDLTLFQRHTVVLLYQPLELATRAQLARDLVLDEARFPRGSSVAFKYGFPFYRVSYLYDVLPDDDVELAFGASGQIRNATIEFAEIGGNRFKSYRGVGFVPLLKARGSYTLRSGAFFGFEVDGIYAPIRGANGSDNEVKGALLDLSLRAGLSWLDRSRLFVNVRYLGGGASGQSDPEPFEDGTTKNWLHAMTFSLGADIEGP